MKREELDNILRNLLVSGNIVTVPFEQMREVRKDKIDFETVSFRELR